MRPSLIALALAATVAGCSNLTPAQQQTLITTATGAAVTLGQVAVANNKTAQQIVDSGILLCSVSGAIEAVAGINVTGTAAAAMDAVCKALGGIGTGLPAGVAAASVPVVSAPVAVVKPAG